VTAYLTIARLLGEPHAMLAGLRRRSAAMTAVGRDHGLLVHAAARTGEGLLVVNLWPDRAGSEAASRDARRLEAVRAEGLTPERMRHEHFTVEDLTIF
jgi:hypothetical protein